MAIVILDYFSDEEGFFFQFTDAPFRTFWFAIKGAVRSTAFLSAFVGIFQVYVFRC
jgi:hypothetical protein